MIPFLEKSFDIKYRAMYVGFSSSFFFFLIKVKIQGEKGSRVKYRFNFIEI